MLNPVVLVTLFLFGAVGAWIGWSRATRPIYRRSLREPDLPDGMTRREFDRRLRRRLKALRVVWTLVYFLLGTLVGGVILMVALRR